MTNIISRLDITQIFCDVDDFYQVFQRNSDYQMKLPSDDRQNLCSSRLCLSEVMTIVIAFQGSGYKTFKEFYLKQVLPNWKGEFPNLVSYNRFVELMPWSLMLLSCFLMTRMGEMTGIAFIDSTPIEVCHPCRARSHKVFGDLHRSIWNFLVNLLGGLIAYTYHPVKPSLDLEVKGLPALPSALF